jgi:hypothetical protein
MAKGLVTLSGRAATACIRVRSKGKRQATYSAKDRVLFRSWTVPELRLGKA